MTFYLQGNNIEKMVNSNSESMEKKRILIYANVQQSHRQISKFNFYSLQNSVTINSPKTRREYKSLTTMCQLMIHVLSLKMARSIRKLILEIKYE